MPSIFGALFEDIMAYLETAKKSRMSWRLILNNHFNRQKSAGGPIIASIQSCLAVCWWAAGGNAANITYRATLRTPNSLQQQDGEILEVESSNQRSRNGAINDVCHRAMAWLLLANARLVLLQPKQWAVPTSDVCNEIIRHKESAVGDAQSAVGDEGQSLDEVLPPGIAAGIRGDEGPRVEPPPRRQSHCDTVVAGRQAARDRNGMIIEILQDECRESGDGIAWPFSMHRGRWRALDHILEAGALRAFVEQHRETFTIVVDPENVKHWGIAAATRPPTQPPTRPPPQPHSQLAIADAPTDFHKLLGGDRELVARRASHALRLSEVD